MKQQLLDDVPLDQRPSQLKDNAYDFEEMTYKRHFDDEELTDLSKEYTRKDQDFWRLEIETKAQIDALKAVLKEKKQEVLLLRGNIRAGYEDVKGIVYLMDDQDAQMMGYYDPSGKLINTRRLRPEERQLKISPSKQSNE